jgi:hypothetical protein
MTPRANTALDAPPASAAGKRRSRLGEILVENGEITATQLEQALAEQSRQKLPIGKVLLKLGYLTEDVMRQSLATQLGGVPFVDVNGATIDRSLARLIHRPYARRHAIVPIAKVGRTLTVAMDDPTAPAVIDELTRMTSFTITVVTASLGDVELAENLDARDDLAPALVERALQRRHRRLPERRRPQDGSFQTAVVRDSQSRTIDLRDAIPEGLTFHRGPAARPAGRRVTRAA